MWCRCCKKKSLDDDDKLIRQSPLICEDLEKADEVVKPQTVVLNHPKAQKKISSEANVELSPQMRPKSTLNSNFEAKVEPERDDESPTKESKSTTENYMAVSSPKEQPEEPVKEPEEIIKQENTGDDSKSEKTRDPSTSIMLSSEAMPGETGPSLTESSPQLSPKSTGSGGQLACRKQNPFFDQPIDCSDKTVADFQDAAFIDFLISKMEDAMDLYSAIGEQGIKGFERIYEDKKNETGHELFIYGQTISTKGSSKVQAIKQMFKLKCKPEEFFFVSNDVETQNRINSNLSLFEVLYSKKTPEYVLELVHSKSKKILMIDSRESLYIKYCKRITEKHIVSLSKSIILADVANLKKDLVTNIQLTAFAYKYCDEDSSNPYTEVEVYNSTDFRSSVGLTLLKPMITKSVKELLKKNTEEIERLKKEGQLGSFSIFAHEKQE